jgi:predicted RNA-binding Zn-ribbon protein involved in translation (DUF1610 family)
LDAEVEAMRGDDERSPERLSTVEGDDDRLPVGTGGGLHCPACDSVARHQVRTKKGTVAFKCDDCGTVYTADGQ